MKILEQKLGVKNKGRILSMRTALNNTYFSCCLIAKLCPTFIDPADCSTPGFSVLHSLLEFAQTHVHWVGDAIQPSHPLSFPSPPALNLSQHQGLFQWVSSLHQVAKVLELQLQHQSFQRILRVDFFQDWLAKYLSHPSRQTPGCPSTLIPYKEPAWPDSGEGASKGIWCLFSHLCGRGPNKALPDFLVWLLINFYRLRRSRTLIGNTICQAFF